MRLWKGEDCVMTGTAVAGTWLGYPQDAALFVVSVILLLVNHNLLKLIAGMSSQYYTIFSSQGGALLMTIDQVGLGEAAW